MLELKMEESKVTLYLKGARWHHIVKVKNLKISKFLKIIKLCASAILQNGAIPRWLLSTYQAICRSKQKFRSLDVWD